MLPTLPDIRPMLLEERRISPLFEPGWIYELKFDGYRLVAAVDKGRVQLRTRGGADANRWFPELVDGLEQLPGGPHVLDGEVCVLDDLGRSDFELLQNRARRRRWYPGADPVVFCAFDLMMENGRSLIDKPLEYRKDRLADLLKPMPPSTLYVGHFGFGMGHDLFVSAVELRLEGVVAKRLGSLYRPGERSRDWIKVKRKGAVPPQRFTREPRDKMLR